MKRNVARLVGFGSAAVVLLTGGVQSARACSRFSCTDSYAAPRAYTAVPSNAPALFVQAGVPGPAADGGTNLDGAAADGGAAPSPPGVISLTTLAGDPIPFSLQSDPVSPKGKLIVPAAPLPVGPLRLQTGNCGHPNDYLFSVLPEAPLPTTIGSVRVSRSLRGLTDSPTNGPCRAPIDAAVVQIEILPSLDFRPYAELAQFTLTVDGEVWAQEGYGRHQSWDVDDVQRADLVYARCSALPNGDAPSGLTPGRHAAQLSVHIAGAASDPPPIAFDFDLDCAGAGASSADAGSADAASTDAPAERKSSSGCQVGGNGSTAIVGPLALLLALAIRRRRRADSN